MSTRRAKGGREHRYPTEATAKLLYGSAVMCAEPACRGPLFKVDEATRLRGLNSRVAHIHARQEHGPRWDPDMGEEANRSADNLLLLCLYHAALIDETPALFPAGLLRAWKAQQIATADLVAERFSLTDAEVNEALGLVDIKSAIDSLAAVVPFNPRMRSRFESWQRAARKGAAHRVERLTPFVRPADHDAVVTWMSMNPPVLPDVPPGAVRVLIGPLGAGKSEVATRWWEDGLHASGTTDEGEIGAFFTARAVIRLEHEIIEEIGGDPTRACRVVIDGLDEVGPDRAADLVRQARIVCQTWPEVSVLASSRPGILITDDERIDLEPWTIERGASLMRAVMGEDFYWPRWNTETLDLLTAPMTTLRLIGRLRAGQDTSTSRVELLSGIADDVLTVRGKQPISDETWQDLSRLAVQIIGRAAPAQRRAFMPLPRLQRLLDTDMVVEDGGRLAFALPVFEHSFGREALRCGLVSVMDAAAPAAFPNWRYPLAFALTTEPPAEAERLMLAIARTNPAAAAWLLDEVRGPADPTKEQYAADDQAITALIEERGPAGDVDVDPPIRAVAWLREAHVAFLDGLGPLGVDLVQHRDGRLVQWGGWLDRGRLSLAGARDRVDPPVVRLDEPHPQIGRATGWSWWTNISYPIGVWGRWTRAQLVLRERLAPHLERGTLRTRPGSVLTRERLCRLSRFIYDYGEAGHARQPIVVERLREKVGVWLEQVNATAWSSWQNNTVDSNDVRWLAGHLSDETGVFLHPPWPTGDEPQPFHDMLWQGYSPELTRSLGIDIVREAISGYRELVELNFPTFAGSMGLYSFCPARIDGVIERPEHPQRWSSLEMMLLLHRGNGTAASPTIEIEVVADPAAGIRFERAQQHFLNTGRRYFDPSPVQEMSLPIAAHRPATNLAYRWLAEDLAAVGWLKPHARTPDQ